VAVSGSGNGATADDAHVTFVEWDNSFDSSMMHEKTRHFQFRGGTKTEMANVPVSVDGSGSNRNRYSSHLAWGANNALWAIMAQYEWDRDVKTYTWDGSTDTWTAGPTTKLWHPRDGGRNMHHYRLNCSAGSTNLLHCAWNVYYWNSDNIWGIGYGALNTANSTWQDTQHVEVLPALSTFHNQYPAIATQNDDVYVFWSRTPVGGGGGDIRAAFKPTGQSAFGSTFSFTSARVDGRRVRALPRLFYPPSMSDHSGAAWDILVNIDGAKLIHYRPGVGVSKPELRYPVDGSFVATAGGSLGWAASVEDGGNATVNPITYRLQVATEASFTNVLVDRNIVGNGDQMESPFGSWVPAESCYYWRIRGTSANLGDGEWSEIRHFCVDDTAPGTFQLLTPANGVDPQSNTPRLTWTSAVDPE
jgi:hypothetical protein